MTLFDIIRNLQAIAAQEPSIRSVSDGDIYDALNAAVDIKYGVFHITQDTHTTNGDLDVWGLNLFFIDRLLDNNENRLSIQSAGITILENVLKRFADTFGAEYMNNIVYTPFTQRFKDNCAGVFCKISISTVMDNLCAEGGKIVLVKNQDKSIDITSNGQYSVTPDYGFSGLGSVDINVDVQGGGCVASEETKTYTANGTYTITPTSGDCISKATVTVIVPSEEPVLQQKSIDIAENGSYSLVPDAGVDGLNRVDINVDVPPVPITPNLQEKSIEITENGNYSLEPNWPYDGLSQVNITVDVPQADAFIVPDEMCFASSRFTTFPSSAFDFSQKTDFYTCWKGCTSLASFPMIDTSKGTRFYGTWWSCSSLTEFPMLDVSKGTDFEQAWQSCSGLTSFPKLNVSNGTNFKNAWAQCSSLTLFPKLDLSNGTNFEGAWWKCTKLTELPEGLNLSKGTNFKSAWYGCTSLTDFAQIDLSSGTNFSYAWYDCNVMQYFRPLYMYNVTALDYAWYHCHKLVDLPVIDTSKVINFNCTWDMCMSLRIFPQFDFSKGTKFQNTWRDCANMTDMPQLDLSSGTDFSYAWMGCHNLVNLGGFGAIKASFDLSDSDVLTVESIMNVINQAATVTGKTMKFGSTNLAKLTDAQKAVATSKGWSLA